MLTLLLPLLLSVDAGRPPPACTSEFHRQFDFWVGQWTVTTPEGAAAGTNDVELTLEGCVLTERWVGSKGGRGTSLNVYDAERKVWHQTWVDDHGGLLTLEGNFRDGKMVLESPARGGKVDRITWKRLPDASVRQLWETSTDAGKTWKVEFDGRYRKRQ